MLAYFRHRQILTQLSKVEMMYLKQLALIGRVSQSTIRRDLKYLEKQGLVTVLNGGGVILNRVNYDYTIKAKINMHVEAKKVIAKYAATLIDDGDCIYLDSGTTVGMMIEFISQKNLSIFTTNVNIIDKLVSKDCECTIIGGYVKKAQGAMVGTITETVMSNLFFDRAFIGVSGISDENGASTPDMREVKKKVLAIEKSSKHYILADSSKLNRDSTYKISDLENSIVISDDRKRKHKLLTAKEHIILNM